MRVAPIILLVVFACLKFLDASAFSIRELGARAMGMGGAFVAIADDGSALYYNPAGIAFQKGWRFEMDGLTVVGLFRFHPSDTPDGQYVPEKGFNGSVSPKAINVMSLYMSKDIAEKWTFGFGVFSPFGLSANWVGFKDSDPWESKFVGRYAGTRARLESIWFQPTVAYQLSENASIGVGVALVHTHLMLEQSILNPLDDGEVFGEELAEQLFPSQDPDQIKGSIARWLPEGRSRLAGTSQSPGFNLGFLYKHPESKTRLGAMYRSAVTHHLDGEGTFAFTPDYTLKPFIGEEAIPELFPDQPIKGSFTTPGTYTVGIANSKFWNSTIAFDFVFQDYQRFESVPVNFTQTEDTATPEELRLEFDFNNSYVLAGGIEKPIGGKTAVRAGYMYDHSPVPDKSTGPLFPDSNRHSFTAGMSRVWRNMEFTFFYQAMKFSDRTTDVRENDDVFTNGLYDNFAHLFGLGLRFTLGGIPVAVDR